MPGSPLDGHEAIRAGVARLMEKAGFETCRVQVPSLDEMPIWSLLLGFVDSAAHVLPIINRRSSFIRENGQVHH
jgi:hypothetical protein